LAWAATGAAIAATGAERARCSAAATRPELTTHYQQQCRRPAAFLMPAMPLNCPTMFQRRAKASPTMAVFLHLPVVFHDH